jgi:hypothetical protein
MVPTTLVTLTGPELVLLNVPLSATAAPPGTRFVAGAVWFTLTLVALAVTAEPEPIPVVDQ